MLNAQSNKQTLARMATAAVTKATASTPKALAIRNSQWTANHSVPPLEFGIYGVAATRNAIYKMLKEKVLWFNLLYIFWYLFIYLFYFWNAYTARAAERSSVRLSQNAMMMIMMTKTAAAMKKVNLKFTGLCCCHTGAKNTTLSVNWWIERSATVSPKA